MLAANPNFLGRVGFISIGGEENNMSSNHGKAKLGISRDETGYKVVLDYDLDLNLSGEKIKAKAINKSKRGGDVFIELHAGTATKRSIVMMVRNREWRVGYYQETSEK